MLVGVTAAPAHAASYSAPLTTAIDDLTTASEVRTGYDRDLFRHWVDADGDGCSTRKEVLIAEADDAADRRAAAARSRGGRWYSYYDRVLDRRRPTLDIDHMVPLAEAWDSGARTWTTATRQAYANDLGDPRSLVAVTARQPVQGRPGRRRVAAAVRPVPLPPGVRRGEAPLAAHRRQRREVRDEEPGRHSCTNSTITVTLAR